jgi:hypothetical protein
MANARQQAPPAGAAQLPKVNIFNRDDFDEALWENGYDVTLEEAVACPCKGTSAAAKVTCSNCLGTGWFFVNPINTKAFITSINKNTKYKDWSPEFIGTMAMTFMNVNRLSYMDKVTLNKNFGQMSELLTAHSVSSIIYGKFVFSTYKMMEVRSVFVFAGDDELLIKLDPSDYRISPTNNYVLEIKTTNLPIVFNGKVSVSYKHKATYSVIDIPHDLRITKNYTNNGKKVEEEMPVQAIARKAQYELGSATNYEGNNINDNSYI